MNISEKVAFVRQVLTNPRNHGLSPDCLADVIVRGIEGPDTVQGYDLIGKQGVGTSVVAITRSDGSVERFRVKSFDETEMKIVAGDDHEEYVIRLEESQRAALAEMDPNTFRQYALKP